MFPGTYSYTISRVLPPRKENAYVAFAVLGLTIFVVTTWKCAQAGGARGRIDLAVGTVLLLAVAFPAACGVRQAVRGR